MGQLSLDRADGDLYDPEALFSPSDAPAPAEAPSPPIDFGLHPGELATAPPGPRSDQAMTDLFGHYTDPAPAQSGGGGGIGKAIEQFGTRDGVQVDKQGIGTTVGDYKLRYWPENHYVKRPGSK